MRSRRPRRIPYAYVNGAYPGAPTRIGARVRHQETGLVGTVAPEGSEGHYVRVLFDGKTFEANCHPRAIQYLDGESS